MRSKVLIVIRNTQIVSAVACVVFLIGCGPSKNLDQSIAKSLIADWADSYREYRNWGGGGTTFAERYACLDELIRNGYMVDASERGMQRWAKPTKKLQPNDQNDLPFLKPEIISIGEVSQTEGQPYARAEVVIKLVTVAADIPISCFTLNPKDELRQRVNIDFRLTTKGWVARKSD